MKFDIDVAVLASLNKGDARADGCDIAVECEGDCLVVVGLADSDCSRLAAATGVGDSLDVNLADVDLVVGSGCCGAEDGKEAEDESRDRVLHSESLRRRGDMNYDLGASVLRRTASV